MESKTKVEIINARVKKIIYNEPATIVFWGDGSKTVVKCMKDQPFNPYHGFTAALAKHIYGSSSAVNEMVDAFAFSTSEDKPIAIPEKSIVKRNCMYPCPLETKFNGTVRLYNWLIGQYSITFPSMEKAKAYIQWCIDFIKDHGWLTEMVAIYRNSDRKYSKVWLEDAIDKWNELFNCIEYRYGRYEIDIPYARRFEKCFANFKGVEMDYVNGTYELTFQSANDAEEFYELLMLYADSNENWCPEDIVAIPVTGESEINCESTFGWTREDLLGDSEIHGGHLVLPQIQLK